MAGKLLTREFKETTCRKCKNCNEAAIAREDFECRAKTKRIRKISGVVSCSAYEVRRRFKSQ